MAEQKDAARAKDRGPVEEIINKRLRPLNKKIQRFRGYHDKPVDTLNEDQRAGLASLPQLEAAARELEELAKHVEEAELVTAAKVREEREAAERVIEARVAERLAQTHLSLANTLGHFLNLHTLLHPARPDDHDNLTFGPLTLPLRLQDEVLATDILRVARMYNDLTSGGDGAHTVIVTLTSGPTGADEEDDRIHRLLELIASAEPETEPESAPDLDLRSNVPEPPQSVQDDLTSAGASTASSVDPQRTPVLNRSSLREVDEPAVMGTMPRGMALNFLQEDELAPKDEDDYEVIEPPSGAVSSRASVNAGTPAEYSAGEAAVESGDMTPASADEAAAGVAAVSLDDPVAADSADASAEASASGAEGAGAAPSGGQQRRNRGQGQGQGQGGQRKPSARKPPRKDAGRGKPQSQSQQGAAHKDEDDGFEVKVARRASSGQQRGRGGGSGGAGSGGRGGGARSGGRGGAPRGERSGNNAAGGERGERGGKENGRPKKDAAGGAGASGKDKDKPAEPKPKPSIYKAVQPGAPASAPIL